MLLMPGEIKSLGYPPVPGFPFVLSRIVLSPVFSSCQVRRFLASYQSRNEPITNPTTAPMAMCATRFAFETIAPFVPTSVPTTKSPSDQYHFFTVASLYRMDLRYWQRKRASSAAPCIKDHNWICQGYRRPPRPIDEERGYSSLYGERPVGLVHLYKCACPGSGSGAVRLVPHIREVPVPQAAACYDVRSLHRYCSTLESDISVVAGSASSLGY